MTEDRKLTLELEEGDAKVLTAALSVLPLLLDSETLDTILHAVRDHDRKLLIVMTAALMAGAERTSKIEEEMNDASLRENMARGAKLLTTMHDFLKSGMTQDGMDN